MTRGPTLASTRVAEMKKNSECPHCGDTGWIVGPDCSTTRCPCILDKTLRTVLPPKFHGAKLADFDPDIRRDVSEFILKPTEGLMLWGPTGSGKTHLACAMMRSLYEARKRPVFVRAADFYAELRESYRDPLALPSEMDILRKYAGAMWLVLDDIASGSLSDHERRSLLDLIDRRGNALLPTVVTTNFGLEDVARLVDERLASRLGSYYRIGVLNQDRRSA